MFKIDSNWADALPRSDQERWNATRAAINLVQSESGIALSPEQLKAVSYFSGFSCLSNLFAPGTDVASWEKEAAAYLGEFIENPLEANYGSVLTSYQTPPAIAKIMWKIAADCGFRGGKVLEPSAGAGVFVGTQPEFKKHTHWTLVEPDYFSSLVLEKLYGIGSTIYQRPFHETSLPDDWFDLVIGCVPYGEDKVHEDRYASLGVNLHEHAVAKSIDLCRKGGLVVLLVDNACLDSTEGNSFRRWIIERCGLVSLVRLPNNAFGSMGNNQCHDLIVFQKRDKIRDLSKNYFNWTFIRSDPIKTMGQTKVNGLGELPMNSYYMSHPSHLLGKLAFNSSRPDRNLTTLSPHAGNEEYLEKIEHCFENASYTKTELIHSNYVKHARSRKDENIFLVPPEMQRIPDYDYCQYQGVLYQKVKHQMIRIDGELIERVEALLYLRKCLDNLLLIGQNKGIGTESVARATLNTVYDEFVINYGKISDKENQSIFQSSPSYLLLTGLESFGGKKSDVFFSNDSRNYSIPEKAETLQDAITYSLNEHGKIDVDFICKLRGVERIEDLYEEIYPKDGDPLLYYDPDEEGWIIAEEYLSEDVVSKLKSAEDACLELNIAALKKVQPLPVLPDSSPDIKAACTVALGMDLQDMEGPDRQRLLNNTFKVRLGSGWVPRRIITRFIVDFLNADPEKLMICFVPKPVNTWYCSYTGFTYKSKIMRRTYGNKHFDAVQLIEYALNNKSPYVKTTELVENPDYGKPKKGKKKAKKYKSKTVLLAKETEDSRDKMRRLDLAFQKYVLENEDIAVELCKLYNQQFNRFVQREYDGSHLFLPGSSTRVTFRPHQKNAIWRGMQDRGTMLAHEVGAGKTFVKIAIAMELKRLGLIKKPMITVQNSTLLNYAAEAKYLYPKAKILVADTKTSFKKENRAQFMASAILNDWDLIIIPHSQFSAIKMSQESYSKAIEAEIADCQDFGILQGGNSATQKLVDQTRRRLEKKMGRSLQSSLEPNEFTFEGMNIDFLAIDEWQQFKNMYWPTSLDKVAGINTSNSSRALDCYRKCRYLLDSKHGRVVLATGTPISNSMTELFTIQMTLQPEALEATGIDCFDQWAGNFGQVVTKPEISPTGTYRAKARFSSFVNIPELMAVAKQVMDIQKGEHLNITRPKPEYHLISSEPCEDLLGFVDKLSKRADLVHAGEVDPWIDNMLVITGEGRKSALDIRLLGLSEQAVAHSKVHKMIWNVWKIWQITQSDKSAQMIFCDLSTPKESFDVYNYARDFWIELGIPASEIAFIHECKNSQEQRTLFDRINTGAVRIALGSTIKLGTGVNAQKRLIALHHLDAPWRPADVGQREGRMIRQGNKYTRAFIFRYLTEGAERRAGFDAFIWQILETKQRFIDQVMNSDDIPRTMEDISDSALNYAQAKAAASGSPIIQEKAELEAEVARLELLRSAFNDDILVAASALKSRQKELKELPDRMDRAAKIAQKAQEIMNGECKIIIGNKEIAPLAASIGEAIIESKNQMLLIARKRDLKTHMCSIGKIGKFYIVLHKLPSAITRVYLDSSDHMSGTFDKDDTDLHEIGTAISDYEYLGECLMEKVQALSKEGDSFADTKEYLEESIKENSLILEQRFPNQEEYQQKKDRLYEIDEMLRSSETELGDTSTEEDGILPEDLLGHKDQDPMEQIQPSSNLIMQIRNMHLAEEWFPAIKRTVSEKRHVRMRPQLRTTGKIR